MDLEALLRISVERGFLTDQIERHLAIGRAYVPHLPEDARWVDLGSGGGIPGLAIAEHLPDSEGTLLDASMKRCQFLSEAIELRPFRNLAVVEARGEVAARELDGTADIVVARSFAAPAVSAEIAARLLRLGGRLVVSEPPEHDPRRWPLEGLANLGLLLVEISTDTPDVHLAILEKDRTTPAAYPRRNGLPAKRPLWK